MRHGSSVHIGVSLAALLTMAASSSSYAASFDCSKASSVVETLICRDPALSQLDDRLSAAYSAVRSQSGNASQLSADQRAWMARRNQCQTATCISSAYSDRLSQLQPQSQTNANEMDLVSLNKRFGENGGAANIKEVKSYLISKGWRQASYSGSGSNRCYYRFKRAEQSLNVRVYCAGDDVIEFTP